MSTAASSSLVRWRPAIIALTAVSAGCALYYLHDGFWKTPDEPPQLHRSNAIHRRSRTHGRGRSSTLPSELTVNISAQELMKMFHEGPDSFGYDSQKIWHPGQQEFLSVSRNNLWTLTQTLEGLSEEETTEFREKFERVLIMGFLCAQMPVNAVLKDPGGKQAFITVFEKEGCYCLDEVGRVLTAWNLGELDAEPERTLFYERNQVPASAERHYLAVSPGMSDSGLFLDESPQPNGRPAPLDEHGTSSEPEDDDDDDDDDSDISWRPEDDEGVNEEGKKEGQTLLNMLYHIAEEQSRQNGYVHRGVSCNSCNMLPIRGIRYRCSNCPDYDLCEQCEAMQVHPKTHLLYKIRVPAPFFDNSQRPQAPRYPGKLNGLPSHLPRHVSKQLSQQSGRESAEIEALWDTFKCLATVEWHSDPLQFGVAIDRDCFDLCFLASTTNTRKPPNMPMHDRIFAFFDRNEDNLIGFEEFVTGVATIRTKDKSVKLKRTFWVYDFDNDGYVCRNDFLFMFRSYYALSKELTLDMIQNMEYDVLEGPNPADIILGTQPISAAYNSALPLPTSRRPGEGKSRDATGEMVISDGGGVITEWNSDLADYWDVIADASEKAQFGYLVDLDALDGFLPSSGDPVGNDHPILHEEWCPAFVTVEDIGHALGGHSLPENITSVADRRKCVAAAIQRRYEVRRIGVERRKERSSFYDPRSTSWGRAEDNELPYGNAGPVFEEILTPSSNMSQKTPPRRHPPPLEEEVGQEFLFQILQEGLNELLDPLFRTREELAIEARKTREVRETIREKLDEFATPNMRKLCAHQINTLEIQYRASFEKDAFGLEIDIRHELRKIISLQDNEFSDEYVRNLKTMLELGVIDQAEFKERMKASKVANPPVNDDENSNGKVSPLSEPDEGGSPKIGSGQGIVSPREEQELDQLRSELEDLTSLEQVHSSAVARNGPAPASSEGAELVATRSGIDPSQHEASESATADSVAALSNQLQAAVQAFEAADAADAAIEQFVASQPLDELLAHTGYTTVASAQLDEPNLQPSRAATTTALPPAEPMHQHTIPPLEPASARRDPTLPQNRPNNANEVGVRADTASGLGGTSRTRRASTETAEVAWGRAYDSTREGGTAWRDFTAHSPTLDFGKELLMRDPTPQELKYHLMLECLEEEDQRRGGSGRLNLEEFETIMNGPRGLRLAFTGMFFEMMNF